jgi:RHS repeat-associated protein
VAFDAAQVVADQWGSEVDLAEIDAISIWGWGERRFADFTLLGETHGVYTAFGQSLASAQTGDVLSPMAQAAAWARPDTGTAIGWQSKAFDAELGLHFNHARWYSPRLGRFTQASPLGGTFEHLYGYGGNSPYNLTDINGLEQVAQGHMAYGNEVGVALGFGPLYPGAAGGDRWECNDEIWNDWIRPVADVYISILWFFPHTRAFRAYLAFSVGQELLEGDLGGAAEDALTLAIVSRVRNPWGRRGSPAHRDRIHEVEARFRGQGWSTVSGGKRFERMVDSSNLRRFPDLVMTNNGRTIAFQIGRRTRGGLPVWRERPALRELRGSGRFNHVFFIGFE